VLLFVCFCIGTAAAGVYALPLHDALPICAIRFRPPHDTGLVLMWADATALPATAAVLESLPAGTRARVWLEVPHPGDVTDLAHRDRKSTRLNSSHVKISYAVFCLKKKKEH